MIEQRINVRVLMNKVNENIEKLLEESRKKNINLFYTYPKKENEK